MPTPQIHTSPCMPRDTERGKESDLRVPPLSKIISLLPGCGYEIVCPIVDGAIVRPVSAVACIEGLRGELAEYYGVSIRSRDVSPRPADCDRPHIDAAPVIDPGPCISPVAPDDSFSAPVPSMGPETSAVALRSDTTVLAMQHPSAALTKRRQPNPLRRARSHVAPRSSPLRRGGHRRTVPCGEPMLTPRVITNRTPPPIAPTNTPENRKKKAIRTPLPHSAQSPPAPF